jgi:hypothetical protein
MPLHGFLLACKAVGYGWTACRNRSESETQPSAISALRSEAS